MYFLNLTLGQFLLVFGSVSALVLALYLLDRSRRRQVVSTLRFWVAATQPAVVSKRRRIQQPWSLLLQLLSIALLLLAIGQLRWGAPSAKPREHVLILDTSAWMSATTGGRTLMDLARERARAYVRALPARDRLMLVRADALATPATAFEPNRKKIEQAIDESRPGATALNIDQALAFARRVQAQSGGRAGEIAFVGTGKIAERDTAAAPPHNLRVLTVRDPIENCGLRKIGVRRSTADTEAWEIYVAVRNFGAAPHTLTLALSFGAQAGGVRSPVGSTRLLLPPGAEKEATFEFRTRAAGLLEADLLPRDAFPDDDRAELELPAQSALRVMVYSDQPELLRPVLGASPQVAATFRRPSEYRPGEGDLIILDRFHPPTPPVVDSIFLDPPADGSPIPVRAQPKDVSFARWFNDHPLGAGLHTKDFRLATASVFEAAPSDIVIGEVEGGPVIVARPGKPKIAVLGFHPALSPMRYELATPLLFANLLRWVAPEIFRRWELSASSVGTIKTALDSDVRPGDVRVVREDGAPVPFTLRDRSVHFFSGTPGTVRLLAGDREYVYSLTLPQLWETRWQPPANARHGIPRLPVTGSPFAELWQWLALLGSAGLLLEWILYGRFRRGWMRQRDRHRAAPAPAPAARPAKVARG